MTHCITKQNVLGVAAVAFAVAVGSAGCSDDSEVTAIDAAVTGPDAAASAPDAGTNGTAIVAPANAWTWVDFPDSSCDEGTATGIGVNMSATSDNVLIYMEGGGACWSYLTCFDLNLAVHGPFTKTQFDGSAARLGAGIFKRDDVDNPFADWNFVYVPYCTADIHGGNNVIDYTEGQNTKTVHHVGHQNVLAYLTRLAPTFPTPPKLVVSGSSAGGFGAAINYATFRDGMHASENYLVDDSGPLFEGNDISMDLRSAWSASWNLADVLGPLCGTDCDTDLSVAYTKLSARYPDDRLALLSSLQDQTIRSYFFLSPEMFQADLLKMAADRLDVTDNFRYFFTSGQTHTMLGHPEDFMSNSTALTSWLEADVNGTAFVSATP